MAVSEATTYSVASIARARTRALPLTGEKICRYTYDRGYPLAPTINLPTSTSADGDVASVTCHSSTPTRRTDCTRRTSY